MSSSTIVVLGANGQLGKELRLLEDSNPFFNFKFYSRQELPIQDFDLVRKTFSTGQPEFCINCAAYTAVDKAESEPDLATLINGQSVGNLAEVCNDVNCKLVHISTDYVFDGKSTTPYTESAKVDPINVYGKTKLEGERLAFEKNKNAIIIRTSWVYSEFGNNFVKTMIRLMKERNEINVVDDQVGSPTYAGDLATAIMQIVRSGSWQPGVYHYSNSGKTSWYGFATEIKNLISSSCNINPIPTSQYPTPAKRPGYSLLNSDKISQTFQIEIPAWEKSLAKCIAKIK